MNAELLRSELLYGAEGVERLSRARVLVMGVGGVGSWCAEALLRTGVGHLTIVDNDVVDVTNINRQLPATSLTVGRPKVEVMAERLRQIRPDAEVRAINRYYDAECSDEFGLEDYDVVIDCIDSVASKAHLILTVTSLPGVRLLSSMGAARRIDPSRVADAEFWKVRGCPLARALRDRFKRTASMPRRRFRCVYSDEAPTGQPKGSSVTVTATFGLRLAAMAVNHIVTGD